MDCSGTKAVDVSEPEERWGHCAVSINNVIYLWGGCTSSLPKTHNDARKLEFMSQISVFEPLACRWDIKIATGVSPLGVRDFAAVAQGNDRLLHFGGYCGHDYCWHNSLHALYINCDQPHWEEFKPDVAEGNAPMKKQDCGLVCYDDANGCPMLCVFGGAGYKNDKEWEATNELHLLCLSKGKWSAPVLSGHAPPSCHGFSFVKVGHSEVLLFGGRIGRKPNGSLSNQLFLLSLNDLTWKQINPSGPEWPQGREGHASSLFGKHLLVLGGLNCHEEALDDFWSLDSSTYSWKKIGNNLPSFVKQRACHTVNSFENVEGSVTFLIAFGGIKKFSRGELHTKQPMMSNSVIFKLAPTKDSGVSVDHCFDLTYMGRQAMTFAKKYSEATSTLAYRDEEIKNLKWQLQFFQKLLDLENKNYQESLRKLTSHLSWDPVTDSGPIIEPEKRRSCSLPTGSNGSDPLNEVLGSSAESVLNEKPSTIEVFKLLKDKSAEWDELGRYLELPLDKRDGWRSIPSFSNENKLERVIDCWLETECHKPVSWAGLIGILESIPMTATAKKVKEFVHSKKETNF